ncbi:hypothetical protein llap_21247 [Limosa lapponica baueri]|uniref:MGT5A-like N-terminal domain-containing protein n=1 Tax=Limosa lapponica baueri TaxID=1758121 RepID=A0A2I0T3S4_LIMLA|nr:hypothetical protein llap_21247 [Limosa lapponica baueri]
MMLLHFTIQQQTQHESSSVLREQILDLSKRYIKALAEENKNVVDGPYVGTVTAYDLKKTLAVLLDNILQRIGKLESKVENLVLNGTGANSTNNTTTPAPSLGAVEKLNVAGNNIQSLACINGNLKSSGILQAQRKTFFYGNLSKLKKIKFYAKGVWSTLCIVDVSYFK